MRLYGKEKMRRKANPQIRERLRKMQDSHILHQSFQLHTLLRARKKKQKTKDREKDEESVWSVEKREMSMKTSSSVQDFAGFAARRRKSMQMGSIALQKTIDRPWS